MATKLARTYRFEGRGFAGAFLALSWRVFALTQCRSLPLDIAAGLTEILTSKTRENAG